jgi:endonuclease/exonuclease/phosphatase family metal-dependent hydrolase
MKIWSILSLSFALVAAYQEVGAHDQIVVMTQNQYLGADITNVVTASPGTFNQTVLDALAQIRANNFPERARALAEEIADYQPDVVGLQEVFSFTINGRHGAAPYRDHLADTLRALNLLGAYYVVAASVQNIQFMFPVDFDGDAQPDATVGVTDRDVLLVRADNPARAVPFSQLCTQPSLEGGRGCNYHASAPTGLGQIKRGFVGIDARIRGKTYRFVNTHLEQREIGPSNPPFAALQAVQAAELIGILQATGPAGGSLIVTGDINSSPEDIPLLVDQHLIIPPYQQFTTYAHFLDSWLLRPGNAPGFTCCQEADLRNRHSQLYERIDMIFTNKQPHKVKARLIGQKMVDKTWPDQLWPSDHATIVAELTFH